MRTVFRDGIHVVMPRDKFQLRVQSPSGRELVAKSARMESLLELFEQFQVLGYRMIDLRNMTEGS